MNKFSFVQNLIYCSNDPDMEIEADEMHENVIKKISEKMNKKYK